ncbi:nitrogen permease regulator 3-like protein [Entomortierella parvispora]|uniref:Nitrogen permease regulator 3 n=1 Tax=Entomortierella parvispora TaxID=205924 RepID=A0A9P3HLE0_9FUNG|nr:nitrogen permease regulator 3-like protein [Entomortierella parvispora]
MDGLVGIIIVTNSSRGHHFVYKYPRERGGITPDDSSGRPYQAQATSSTSQATTEEFQVTSKVLGYDPQFLANLLSPKLALCDKRFQLTVDDLTFIGHPVSMSGPEFRQRRDYWKWRASKPPKEKVKRGWIVGGAAPFLGDDDDSDSDFYGEDSNDEGDSGRGSVTSKGAKDGVSGLGAGTGAATATATAATSVVKEMMIRRGSKEEPDSSTAARSSTDPAGWRQQRFRSHTYNSNPTSPSSGDSPQSIQNQQQNTPSLAHQSSFASATPSLLHHPMSMPQTPIGGVQGNTFSSHLAIPPPIQITQGNVSSIFSHTVTTPSAYVQQMSFFHVVFVLKPPELQLNSAADQVYKNIACKLTAALRYEELNSQYVSQEATKILGIREEAAQSALTLEKFHEQVLAASSLARAVRSIYDCISADKVCHVVLNDSIDISLQIPHLAPLPRASSYITRQIQRSLNGDSPTTNGTNTGVTSSPAVAGTNTFNGSNSNIAASQQALMTPFVSQYGGIGGMGYMMDDYEVGIAYEYENFPILFPYHTLLLLEDPEEILKDIPLDASPTLVKLVQILVPYQCLDELQYILDCSMAQIYRLASHLIYWRKAKLIDQIRISNVYVVAPQAGINENLVNDFSQHFPTLSLPSVLHELSTPKAYKAHIPGAGRDKEVQTVYLEMLTYLLRKDLVVQLHTYILVLVPEYIKLGCSAEEYEHLMSEENSNLFSQSHGSHMNGGTLTPTLESPTLLHQHGTSAKSADFALLQQQQLLQHQQHQQMQKQQQQQQTMPSQTYRYHNRSLTGPKTGDATGPGASSSGPALQGGPSSANSVGAGAIGLVSASVSGAGGVGMISSSFKSHMSTGSPFGRLYGKRQDASSILSNPGQASETEREWVMRMCENQPQSVAELFMRLIHYFDGQHHVEEILFREQIVAKDLKTVLSAFREFLILTWA